MPASFPGRRFGPARVQMECLRCGHVWLAPGRVEEGAWLPEDDADLFCAVCGADAGEGGERHE